MSRLGLLAVNGDGFIFDPTTGDAFTCNPAGMLILQGLKDGKAPDAIALDIVKRFDTDLTMAEKDVIDFRDHLRSLKLT